MKQYYYANGDQQLGPFTLQELKSKPLKKDTYVWYEGLADWTRAGDLPDLDELFETPPEPIKTEQAPLRQTPPPTRQESGEPQRQRRNQGRQQYQQYDAPVGEKPKTWLVESIIVTVLCCFFGAVGGVFGIIGIVFASQVDSKWARGDDMGAKKASENAKIMLIIALSIGALITLFYAFAIISGGLMY